MPSYQVVASDVVPAAPPITVASLKFFGFPLSEWLILLTVIYTIIIILIAVRKLVAPWVKHDSKEDPPCAENCPAIKRLKDGE